MIFPFVGFETFRFWCERQATRASLGACSAHDLADLGIAQGDAVRASAAPPPASVHAREPRLRPTLLPTPAR